MCCSSDKNTSSPVAIGAQAPRFSLPDQDNKQRSPYDKEYEGKRIVLYFYPKDGTPGCTKEACNIRDYYKELTENNIVVLGVSFDTPERHQAFKKDHHLPFTLLSDSDKNVATSYEAVSDWWLFKIPKRKTFLLDEQKKIIAVLEDIVLDKQAQMIIEMFKKNSEE